jgi:diamine N-acetyltransferase
MLLDADARRRFDQPVRRSRDGHLAQSLHMNSLEFELRAAYPSDAVTIAALSVQVFLHTYATQGVRPDLAHEAFAEYSAEVFARRLDESNRAFILAEAGTGVLGYAEVLLSPLAAPAAQVSGAELVRLYVQPAAQRLGIGCALLERTEQAALAALVPAVWLTAWEGNVNAGAFYARMGYADVGTTTYSFRGHTYANRVFAKRLAATRSAG